MLKTFIVKVTPSKDGRFISGECGGRVEAIERDHARTAGECAVELAETVINRVCLTSAVEVLNWNVADFGPELAPWDQTLWVWVECILTDIGA